MAQTNLSSRFEQKKNLFISMFNLQTIITSKVHQYLQLHSQKNDAIANIHTRLHTNENPFGSPLTKWYNRYPHLHQQQLKQAISSVKNIATENITVANGSNQIIDNLLKCFCNSVEDNVIVCPPTERIFESRAILHGITIKEAPLLPDFQLNLSHVETLVNANTKIIWLSSPNNPTGNNLYKEDIETILNNFTGIVVVDETYINFSRQKTMLTDLLDYQNLVVLQSLDIAWGLAGLQVSMAFASSEIASILDVINPSIINTATIDLCVKALTEIGQVNDMILEIVNMREALSEVIKKIPFVEKVYPSQANFLFVKMKNANEVYDYLLQKGIQIANFSQYPFCENCLRITIGTEKENTVLVDALFDYFQEIYK